MLTAYRDRPGRYAVLRSRMFERRCLVDEPADEAFRFVSADIEAGRSIKEYDIWPVGTPSIDHFRFDGAADQVY